MVLGWQKVGSPQRGARGTQCSGCRGDTVHWVCATVARGCTAHRVQGRGALASKGLRAVGIGWGALSAGGKVDPSVGVGGRHRV